MSGQIIVTGAAGALGRDVVALLRARGLSVTSVDLANELPGDATFVGKVDLTDERSVVSAFASIAQLGPVAGLVNIAGGFTWETVADGSAQSWERIFRINTLTALNACRAALPSLQSGGSIVNVGAAAAARAARGMGAYTASKSGVMRLTEALAEEVKERGIRVNAVLPSIIDTPSNRRDMGDADAGKWVKPAELGEVIAFLLSDAASAVTGANIPVTGRV